MNGRDIYLKRTEAGGKTMITQHRVWDADLFLSNQQEEARKISKEKPKEAYSISFATEAEFKGARA